MFTVFVHRSRPDSRNLAPCQDGFDEVCHGGAGFVVGTGGHYHMHFVDEKDNLRIFLHILQDSLEPVFELALHTGPSQHSRNIKCIYFNTTELLRNISSYQALCKAFNNSCFSSAGRTNKDGIILGLSGKNLKDAACFVIATYNRLKLSFFSKACQITGKTLEGFWLMCISGIRFLPDYISFAEGSNSLRNLLLFDTNPPHQLSNLSRNCCHRPEDMLQSDI